MERVIKVPEVQDRRSDADAEAAKLFFDNGRRPGLHGTYLRRVDRHPHRLARPGEPSSPAAAGGERASRVGRGDGPLSELSSPTCSAVCSLRKGRIG